MLPNKSIQKHKGHTPNRKGKPAHKKGGTYNFSGERDWHWMYTLMIIGIFLCVFTLAFVGHYTLVSKIFLSKVLAFVCFIGLLIPHRLYIRWFGANRWDALFFNLFAVGPLLFSSMMWLNFSIRTSSQQMVHEVVESYVVREDYPGTEWLIFHFKDSVLFEDEYLRRFELTEENVHYLRGRKVQYEIATGLLGYDIMVEREVLME